jgi:hypothetical protein
MITTPVTDTAKFVAEVITEAITCDRADCFPEYHTRFVVENMAIATEHVNEEHQR